jgi:hypothetical protein
MWKTMSNVDGERRRTGRSEAPTMPHGTHDRQRSWNKISHRLVVEYREQRMLNGTTAWEREREFNLRLSWQSIYNTWWTPRHVMRRSH